jgi:K+-sensing histidine kinase KdpD
MSACSFVKNAVNESEPLITEESRVTVREDVDIIENSLHFVNDLLRNMLDMHRAASKQLKVNLVPSDILHDILEPVESILYQRRGEVNVFIECPPNLFAITDRLRLKQIMLNLGRNSSKFVEKGFIRLRAEVVDNSVRLIVEDSGPGVPEEKRERLFAKFQESLDSLSQGTVRSLLELESICSSLCSHLMPHLSSRPYSRLLRNNFTLMDDLVRPKGNRTFSLQISHRAHGGRNQPRQRL